MSLEKARHFDEVVNNSICNCSECNTAFCVAKRNHQMMSCHGCKEYNETSVFYFGEKTLPNTNIVIDAYKIKSAAVKKSLTSEGVNTSPEINVNSTEIIHKIYSRHSYKSVPGVNDNVEDFNIAEVDKKTAEARSLAIVNSRKNMSTTTAELSAQIMDVSYKDFKESLSREEPVKVAYNTNDIFKKIKEAYDACSCKICECITGKSILAQAEPCNCEPCNCKDCTSFRKELLNVAIDPRVRKASTSPTELERIKSEINDSKICNCKPCDCIECLSKSNSEPCSCKPCQCYECKTLLVRGNKTVIVAPVGEDTHRENCLCAPCDCTRCSHRGLSNLYPNRVHEISTGINRHPNCHCEACVNESCEPNGTDSCRCEGRRGVISKPVEKNPHDFDIHRATVVNNPMNSTGKKPTVFKTISTYVAMNSKKYPPNNNNLRLNSKTCECSVCECIVCKCKGNDFSHSKVSQNVDKTLKALKLPSMEMKSCKCSPCECQYCSYSKYSTELKRCTCEVCDCIHCEGELKPKSTISRIIPVIEPCSEVKCQCRPCECSECQKAVKARKGYGCQCDVCRCKHCADNSNASNEGLYPIKKGKMLTSSMLRNDPLSDPELLSRSSEYTHLKHSMAQSNVFQHESNLPERSQLNFTIYHVAPENSTKQSSYYSAIPFQPVKKRRISDSLSTKHKERGIKLLDNGRSSNDLTQFYCASTSKTEGKPSSVIEKADSYRTCDNAFKSVDTSCLNEIMESITGFQSQAPSLLSIPSTNNLLYLSPSSLSYNNKTSCQFSISSPDSKFEHSMGLLYDEKNMSFKKVSSETCNLKQIGCLYCGSSYNKTNFNRTQISKVTQTLHYDNNFYKSDEGYLKDPFLKYVLLDHSNVKIDPVTPRGADMNCHDSEHDRFNKNKYYAWRFDHPNPRSCSSNTKGLGLSNKNIPYESALVTLQKAKEFSAELIDLLAKYDKANTEFESISKKLKQSHESILNDFHNDVYGRSNDKNSNAMECCTDINSKYSTNTINLFKSQKPNLVTHFSSVSKEPLKCNISWPVIVKNSKKALDAESFKARNYCHRCGLVTNILGNKVITASTTSLIRDKHNDDFFKKRSSKQIIGNSDHDDTVTKDHRNGLVVNLSQVDHEVELGKEPNNTKHSASHYKVYKKLTRKASQKNTQSKIDNGLPVGSLIPKTIEAEILQSIIRQELHTIIKQFSEIQNDTLLFPTSGPEGSNNRVDVIKSAEMKDNESLTEEPWPSSKTTLIETKLSLKSLCVSDHEVKDAEKFSLAQIHPVTEQRSSYFRNKALEKLQFEVKELLNMAVLQSTSNQDSLGDPATESEPNESRSRTDLLISPAVHDLKHPLKPTKKKTRRRDSELKAKFLGLRRVSDHTVMVKWKTPKRIADIKGYEILVDGKAVQKFFAPSECIAVVTCLPHCERVELTIRSITKAPGNLGKYPCETMLYRPRAK